MISPGLLRTYFDVPRLQAAARGRQFYLGADPANAMDVITLRLVAARNLGLTAAFEAAGGRSFTGTRADYADLNAIQQETLTDEMLRLIREDPERFTSQQVAVAASQTRPFSQPTALEQQSYASAAAQGAAEGARAAATFAQDLITGAAATGGTVLSNVLGGSVSGVLTKLALVAVVGAGLYLAVTRLPAKKG